MALPKFEKDIAYISKLDNEPNDVGGLSAGELKARFDAAGQDIQEYINDELIPRIESDIEAAALGVGAGGAIDGSTISDGSISTAKLADGAVTTAKIADNGISTAKLADNAVTSDKLADNAVTSSAVADEAITRVKLADESVSADKIFPGAVGNAKLAANAVTAPKVAGKAITRAKLANDALYSPVVNVTTETYSLTAADYGKTLFINASGQDVVIDITEAFSESCPAGVEFAAFVFAANTAKIMFAGIRVFIAGEQQLGSATGSGAVLITQPSGMVGIKKLYSNPSYGDVWTITGNVEVVS